MTSNGLLLTPLDRALLRELDRQGSLVAACRTLGIGRDRGVYRIQRIEKLGGGRVTRTVKGGRSHGGSRLTPLGRRLSKRGAEPLLIQLRGARRDASPTVFTGTWHENPVPHVISGVVSLEVGFTARDGERVRVGLDPDSVLVARQRFPSSARNVLAGTVRRVLHRPGGRRGRRLRVDVRGLNFSADVTPESERRLRIVPGARVYLYVKAMALKRLKAARVTPGFPRR